MDTQLRKGALELVQKWRKTCRNTSSRGFESETYAVCARDLEELLTLTTQLPNEDSYVEALFNAWRRTQACCVQGITANLSV
jgi:hypothetical protein